MRVRVASGAEARALATDLLQRARLTCPDRFLWEAADVQWWSRRPRASDAVPLPFWLDDDGPVAAVLLTSWRDDRWQCDPLLLAPAEGIDAQTVWQRAAALMSRHARGSIEILLRDDDPTFPGLVSGAGFHARDHSTTAGLRAADRPAPRSPSDGFVIVDRALRPEAPHPMRARNGEAVAERLLACSLYDPELDLAVEADDGRVAGYSLFWFDPVTRIGLVEPVRVLDEFQRRGLATAMLTEGVDRLAGRGAEQIKIGYESEAAAATYRGVGFRPIHTDTTWVLNL